MSHIGSGPLMPTVLLLCLLLLFLGCCLAAGPQPIAPPTYFPKSGQLSQSQLIGLQYEVDFDQDLYRLDFINCRGNQTCSPPPACLPCDYSAIGSPQCGTSPSGPQCSCPYRDLLCNASTAPDAQGIPPPQTLVVGQPLFASYNSSNGNEYYRLSFRAYVPDGGRCSAVRVVAATHTGLIAELLGGFAPPLASILPLTPWRTSYRQDITQITMCPEDSYPLYQPGGGTLYLNVRFDYDSATDFTLLLTLVPLDPPATFSPAAPVPGTLPLPLGSHGNLSGDPGAQDGWGAVYSTRLTGPCPRFFGFRAQFPWPVRDDSLYYVFLTVSDVSGSTPSPAPYWTDSGSTETFLALSFCPSDGSSSPTVLKIELRAYSGSRLDFFSSAQPARFLQQPTVTSEPAMLSPLASASVLANSARLHCPGGVDILPPSSYLNVGNMDFDSAELQVLPPIVRPPPTWPIMPLALPQDGAFLRQFAAPDIPDPEYSQRLLNFVVSAQISIVNDLGVFEHLWVPQANYSGCQIYLSPNLVNAQGEAVPTGPIAARVGVPGCSVDGIRATKEQLDALLVFDTIATDVDAIAARDAQLDMLEWSDDRQACLYLAERLLDTRRLDLDGNTTLCNNLEDGSPCCNVADLFNDGPCLPRPSNYVEAYRTLNTSTARSLPSAECVGTYLDSFGALQDVDCLAKAPSQRSVTGLPLFNLGMCLLQVFGYGEGQACIMDSVCGTGWCDKASRLCVRSLADSYRVAVECFLRNSSAFLRQQLASQLGAAPPPLTDDIPDWFVDSVMLGATSGDCVAETVASFYQRHQDTRMPEDCQSYCPGDFLVLSDYAIYPACVSNAFSGDGTCRDVFAGFFDSIVEPDCPTGPTFCNWDQNINSSQSDCLARGAFCGVCWNSTYCQEPAPGLSQADCGRSVACQLANGSYAVLSGATAEADCGALFACSEPCWDSGLGGYRACRSQSECETVGGTCLDGDLWHWNATGGRAPGVCLWPRVNGLVCGEIFDGVTGVNFTTLPAGCALHNLAEAACVSLSNPPRKVAWVVPAHTAGDCKAHGEGCFQPNVRAFDGGLYPYFGSGIHAPPLLDGTSSCSACPLGECVDYFQWRPGRWLPGEVRPLQWVQPQMVPWLRYNESAFSFTLFTPAVLAALEAIDQEYLFSTQQCRFHRLSPALEAVACAVSFGQNETDAVAACLDEVTDLPSLPLASGFGCYGDTSTLLAPVATQLTISADATAGCGDCALYANHFVVPARTQQLSSYWLPPPAGGPAAGSLELANGNEAAAGTVAGDGFRLELSKCPSLTGVTVCFQQPSPPLPWQLAGKNASAYPVLDIAVGGSLSTLRPLGAAISRQVSDTVGAQSVPVVCAWIGQPLGSGSIVAPVWRATNWTELGLPPLSSGAEAALYITASGYLIVTLLACAVIAYFLVTRTSDFYTLLPFYLSVLLGAASCIRAASFFLLGSHGAQLAASGSSLLDVALVELPTFLWLTATTLVVAFWLVLTRRGQLDARKAQRQAIIGFLVANAAMYLLFVLLLVLFAALGDVSQAECQGRLEGSVDGRRRRAVFVAYQALVAGFSVLVGVSFAIASIRLLLANRRDGGGGEGKSKVDPEIVQATVTGLLIAGAMVVHASLLLALALAEPGVPELCLLLFVPEIVPAAVLLWQLLPRHARLRLMPACCHGSGGGAAEAAAAEDTSRLGLIEHEEDGY